MAINWGILSQFENPGNAFMQGVEKGEEIKAKREMRGALAGLAANPDDPQYVNALMPYKPELAIKIGADQRERADKQAFGQAAVRYYQANNQQPVDNDGDGLPDLVPQTDADQEFLTMLAKDPTKAFSIKSDLHDAARKRIDFVDKAYDRAIRALGSVTDAQSYGLAYNQFATDMARLGVEVPASVPREYPGPDGIRQLLTSALDAKEQIAAIDRRDRIEWDQEDDRIDNARADRREASMDQDRGARRDIQRRGQDIRDATQRRGQDMRGRKAKGSAENPVSVKSPDQARKLKPGTFFKTPDGRVKVR